MKIVVCSLYINPWYREVVKYGKRSLENYCAKHGYDFVWETEETEDGVYPPGAERDVPWYKIQLLLKCMANSDADFVVWNDADSMIVDPERKLEDMITKHLGNNDILVAKDWLSVLNTGTVFVRNCEYSKQLLTLTWDNKGDYASNLHEQASLADLYERNVYDAQEHVVVLPIHLQNEFLSYWYTYWPGQCFIIHATRCAHNKMGFIFTIDMFCPLKMDEETEEDRAGRIEWMNDAKACREDIDWYLSGGEQRHFSKRYLMFRNGEKRFQNP